MDRTAEEATALLDTLLGAAPVGFGMLDTELRYVRVNPALAAINGLPAEAHLGHRPTEVLRPVELAAQAEAMLGQVLASGEPALDLALSGQTPDRPGVERHWTGSFYPVRSQEGQMLGVGVVVAEVTEHARMAQALRESNTTMRAIVDNSTAIIYLKDLAGRYLLVNRRFEQLFGVSHEQARARTDHDMFPAEVADRFRANDQEVLASKSVLEVEEVAPHPDGPHTYLSIKFPLLDEDGAAYAIGGISVDITDHTRTEAELRATRAELERRAAELERSNAELEQFAYAASHDLREPLRAIAGYGKLLERRLGDTLDEQSRELLDYALDGAARLQTLIDDLLAYARASHRPLDRGPVALDGLVEQCLRRLAPVIADSGAQLHVGELPTVDGDETQLCQVVQNLVSNALKFCEQTPDVTVTAAREEDAWRIDVADNGVGIPPGQADRVFEMFSRLHSHRYPGTGIGLALCHRILERHGGRIWHEPGSSGGTVFHFTLPDQARP